MIIARSSLLLLVVVAAGCGSKAGDTPHQPNQPDQPDLASGGPIVPVGPVVPVDGGSAGSVPDLSAPGGDAGVTAPSGEPAPVGDLPGWRQIFVDDFAAGVPLGSFPAAVSTRWSGYPHPWSDTSKNGTYWPEKVISIHDGVMDLYLHTENGVHCVAAPYPLLPGASSSNGLAAGRYAIRFRADAVDGYKTAWLLWPDSEQWPLDGEIDFPEGDLTGTISGYMHRMNGTSGGDQDAYSTGASYPTWHTAVVEWRPDLGDLKLFLDGALIGHSTSRVPSTPMHWVIQTETALSSTPPPDNAAGHVEIDWVAVYTPGP